MPSEPLSHLRDDAWKTIANPPGWLVLMDSANGFKTKRLVLSQQDEFFLKQEAIRLYPSDHIAVIGEGQFRYLVRRPA